MLKYTSTYVQDHFKNASKACQTEPVHITKNDSPCAVLLSPTEYKRLTDIENKYWGELAELAESCGFMDDHEVNLWVNTKTNHYLYLKITRMAFKYLDSLTKHKCENILVGLKETVANQSKKIKKTEGYNFKQCDFGKNKVIFDGVEGAIRIIYVGER